MFLAIDPGAHPGWCVLNTDFTIKACGIGEAPEGPRLNGAYEYVLCERPTIYPYSKVDPRNIITLAISAGDLTGLWRRKGSEIRWVEPRTWKGSIDKKSHHAAIIRALSPADQAAVSKCAAKVRSDKYLEDMMDAVGLAMYGKRMGLFAP